MELLFMRFFRRLVGGATWSIGWTAQTDSYPTISYTCPYCRNAKGSQQWQAGGAGFKGVAPIPTCCAQAIPYPVDDDTYLAHLSARARFSDDAGHPITFERTAWEGDYGYGQHDPGSF
ncbi:MAG: hypothetical protein WA211_10065 [Candidatus Acidiferrales bacterium]